MPLESQQGRRQVLLSPEPASRDSASDRRPATERENIAGGPRAMHSTPSSRRDERIDHITRPDPEVADAAPFVQPRDSPIWRFRRAQSVSARAPRFGESYGKGLPFWRKALMALRARRKQSACDTPDEYDDPSSLSLLNGKNTHKNYRRVSFVFSVLRWLGVMLGLLLCFFGVIHIVNILINLGPVFWDDDNYRFTPSFEESRDRDASLLDYPTDFTRGIKPLPCHSHNDYWRRVPLFEALRYGCRGVEADVWLFPDAANEPELFVGHNTASLTSSRTFRNLYVDPIVKILDRANSPDTYSVSHQGPPKRPNGVWDEDPSQSLVLLVDFKNDGEKLWPVVQWHLESLRSRGYLTYWNGTDVIDGPVVVVATGNAPFDLLTANSTYRDIFFDAPLAMLYEEPEPIPGTFGHADQDNIPVNPTTSGQGVSGLPPGTTADSFNSSNSYYASVSFGKAVGRAHLLRGGKPTAHQLRLIRGQIQGAQKRGLKPRYWGTPSWPIAMRNQMWDTLVREGVSFLNVDDLKAASRWDWSARRHRTWFWE